MKNSLAVIFSLSGPHLTDDERAFFKDSNPLGFILFARNCENPDQLRALNRDLRDTLGRDCPVLIDQEGGRVQRLRPPFWREYPPAQSFGDLFAQDENRALEDLRLSTLMMAEELRDVGFNVDCAPVLDVPVPGAHDVIGDRAFSGDPSVVARLGLSVCRNLLAAGITPVIKHIPGHGRAGADSHKDLPRVKTSREGLENDFAPFRALAASDVADALWAMTAHVVYEALDPEHPASASPEIIRDIIRGEIGFNGFLVSDDVDMQALQGYGDVAGRTRAVMAAGCDAVLHCSGNLPDMKKIAEIVPKLPARALQSLQKAADFRRLAA